MQKDNIVAGIIGAGLGFGAKYALDYLSLPPTEIMAVASGVTVTTGTVAMGGIKHLVAYDRPDLGTKGYLFAAYDVNGDILCVFSVARNAARSVYEVELGSQHGNPVDVSYGGVLKATLPPSVPFDV